MCDIPVNLPTLASFLMLYSLRCGCIIISIWTLCRSILFLVFFVLAVIWMYMPESEMKDSQPTEYHFFYVFLSYLAMIVTESFVFIGSILLAMGLICENSFRVGEYLTCRFCALVFETLALVCLSFHHHYYIGWYLVFLMIIILEFYSFIVVYSYYVDMACEEKQWEQDGMGEGYKSRTGDLCVNYANLPERRQPSVSGVSQDTRDIEASQTTRDTTDTPNTRTTRDMSTRSDTRKPKDKQRDKLHMRELRRIMRFK